MSREPQSAAHRLRQARGFEETPKPPQAKPAPAPKQRKLRIVVEPAKPMPAKPAPEPMIRMNQAAFDKWTNSTERLTAEELKVVRGLRLSRGGPAANEVRRQIEEEVRKG